MMLLVANNVYAIKQANNPRAFAKNRKKPEDAAPDNKCCSHVLQLKIQRHQVINKVHPHFAAAINNTVTKGITVITHIRNNYRIQT